MATNSRPMTGRVGTISGKAEDAAFDPSLAQAAE